LNKKILIPLLALTIIFSLGIPQAFATEHYSEACVGCTMEEARASANQTPEEIPISVWTDKTEYGRGDMIMVEGKVEEISGFPVTITVVNPLNLLVTVDQLTVSEDGSFETTINIAGIWWEYDGTYTIKVNYGSSEKNNSVKVELTGGEKSIPPIQCVREPCELPSDDTSNLKTENIELKNRVATLENKNLDLQKEVTKLKVENKKVTDSNSILQSKIDELTLEIDNLQDIVMEQIRVIMEVLQDLKNK